MACRIILGSNCGTLGMEIAAAHNANYAEVKRFPDKELYVRVPADVKGQKIVYVQSFYPNQNESLMEAFLTIDALFDMGAQSVELFAPYFAYARQDRRCNEGEAVSAGSVTKMFKRLGVEKITSVNAHQFKKEGTYDVHGLKFTNVNAAPLIIDFVKNQHNDVLLVLPDAGSRNLIGMENAIYFDKRRGDIFSGKADISTDKKHDLKGKRILLMDDMISTGSTISEAYKKLVESGAEDVIVSCVHGLFVGGCMDKFKANGIANVISTNTVDNPFSRISVLPILKHTLSDK